MDSGTSIYDKIIAQCKSTDIDAKVEALSKLQTHFGKGVIEVPDPEALVNILKVSLRTSNLHLTNATLSALPTVLPSLITRISHTSQFSTNVGLAASSSTPSISSAAYDIPILRLALNAFLPAGGVIDRLGDKEKVQAKARESLVLLGGYSFRAGGSTMSIKSGKGQETPLSIFERVLKEGGLSSKVWKVREQSILTLVHIRRAHHLFPIRPYLPLLVDCLEDTDAHVRECARQSVVELFTGPAITDAARADLKKELSKKGVRKAIVDDVLTKLLTKVSEGSNSQNHEGLENGNATAKKKEYTPPSLILQAKRPQALSQADSGTPVAASQATMNDISRPGSRTATISPQLATLSAENVDITPVYIASSRDLENEFASMQKPFEGKETEHNWAAREQGIQLVRGMLKGDVHNRYPESFLSALKDGFIQWSLKALASLRTTVSVNTCLLYTELVIALGTSFDPHCDVLLTHLLKMAGFTKKITAQQSQSTVTVILSHTSAQPRLIIPLLFTTLQEKNVQSRAFAVGHLKHYIEVHGQRSRNAIESSGNLDVLERSVKKALADPNPGVRESARIMFWLFAEVWKERGTAVLNTLDATARKQLKRLCPNPENQVVLPSTPENTKKTSVAAAIAASRAKAKAIASAPPSLRHQATSHAPRRDGSPNVSPKGIAPRSGSSLRASSSPDSPTRARLASASLSRSTNASIVRLSTTSHSRKSSGGSETKARGVSPTLSDGGAHRRISSPLAFAATGASIRKTMGNPLPASPSSEGQASPSPPGLLAKRNGAIPVPPRSSLVNLSCKDNGESLLMAQSVPIPEDSDSEDGAIDVLSFSAAYQQISPIKNTPNSRPLTLSLASDSGPPASVSNALSTGSIDISGVQQPVVEDALRARAEQAESAAERLLELVEPEDDITSHNTLPPSLLKSTNGYGAVTSKPKMKPQPLDKATPKTPESRASTILKQAALFVDSPEHKNSKPTSLLDVLRNQKQETGWWMKRKILLSQVTPNNNNISDQVQELNNLIPALEQGDADVAAVQRLALFFMGSSVAEVWEEDKTFERFFKALMSYLQPTRVEDELAYGLIVVWDILENLSPYLDGKEGDLFAMVLRVRYCNKISVLEGTNAIRDAMTSKLDPVYGLTTVHASLIVFHAEPIPSQVDEEAKAATSAFGLMALGKFILRLPAEIAEEELPRLKGTLITSLNDRSSLIVRESAAAAIIAAQLVLRDETHLFALLDGLADEKKNLLTYLFDKHGVRSLPVDDPNGVEKLEREMRRLDTRTSTPLRGGL